MSSMPMDDDLASPAPLSTSRLPSPEESMVKSVFVLRTTAPLIGLEFGTIKVAQIARHSVVPDLRLILILLWRSP